MSDKREADATPIIVSHEIGEVRNLVRCSSSEARELLSYERALALEVLPLAVMSETGHLIAAAGDSEDLETIAALRFATGRQVRLIPISRPQLRDAIFSAYHGDDKVLQEKVLELRSASPSSMTSQEDRFRSAAGDAARFLTALVDYAIARDASDVHLVPTREGARLSLRLNGELLSHNDAACTTHQHMQLVARVKVLSGLDSTVRSVPQDGSFTLMAGGREVGVRVSVMPTLHGEKVVLRFPQRSRPRTIAGLGILRTARTSLERFLTMDEGAAFFAGPTGSGKTTTLYASISHLAARGLSAVSIEDPVELPLDGVAQTSVNEKCGATYAACLRAILRQDPDAIMIGEIRDRESASIAMQAALTGHLVLTSVHARGTFEVMLRLRNLGVDDLTLAQAGRLIVCQRLVQTLCDSCKVIDLSTTTHRMEVFKRVGCALCDYTGYGGSSLAVELVEIGGEISELLFTGRLWDAPERFRDLINVTGRESLTALLESGSLDLAQFERIASSW